jgi:tetratricopeptide (TPR) repeat protein
MRTNTWLRRGPVTAALLLVLISAGCTRSPEAKSAAYIEAGKKLLEKKDPGRAILQFRNATQVTPKNAEAHYQLALAYLAAGDLRNSVAGLRKALNLDPKHAAARFRLADLMTNASDPDVLKDAQQRLQALLQDTPENADALHSLALTELKLGETDAAIQHLGRAMATAPNELVYAVTLAQAKLQQSDVRGAESVLKKAGEDFPKSADAAVILGRFYAGQNRNAEAEQQFQRGLTVDPTHVAALLNLATLQYQLGRKQDAEQTFKRLAISSDKTYQPAYGNFLFQEGRREEAVAEFEKLAKQSPDDRTARTRLVAAYQAVNRVPEAQKILNDVLKKNPKDMDALLQRGELFLTAGKYPEAEADLNNVVHMNANSAEVHYALAAFHQARGAAQRQRQELNEVLRLNPLLLQARLELSRSLVSDNAGQAAVDILDAAPADQRNLVVVAEERNWGLLAQGKEAEAQKGVNQGLAAARTSTFLIQDAVLKIRAKRFAEARVPLHEALVKAPEEMRAYQILIATYRAQNQMHGAVEEIKAYVAQRPKSADLQYLFGNLLLETGDKVHAKEALTAAKALKPESTATDLSIAQIDLLQSNWNDARRQLNSILSTKGENPQAEQWLGMLEVSSGNKAAAIQNFRKVLETQPDNAVALNNLAYLLVESGDQSEEPLRRAQRAVELDPKNPDFADTLGWVLFRRGVYSVAVTHLERAASTKPTAVRQYHLAMAYYKAGQEARGRTALQAGLRLDPTLPEARAAQELIRGGGAAVASRP